MKPSDVQPPAHGTAGADLGLLSRTGPEAPPDLATSPVDEPTDLLPTITPRRVPPPPPRVAARAVIVYEPQPRRSWGLWVFTGLLVALTVGVVLGQTAAFRPVSRAASAAQTEPLPTYVTPPAPPPAVTEPLGAATTATIEVGGAAALLQVRTADLGPLLFSAAAPAGGPMPGLERTRRGPRLTVGTHTELLLNTKVRWTLRLTGRFGAEQVDLRGGGVARIELTGDSPDATLDLPRPAGTVPLRVTGRLGKLQIRAAAPVRVKLGRGAATATMDGTQQRSIRAGATLNGKGWRSADERYDVTASKRIDTVLVDRTP
jgi:hypothetical protein